MTTVRIRNVNPLGHVDVPILRRQDDPEGSQMGTEGVGGLEPGEVLEVDESIAGHAPVFGDDGEVLDYGSGLLAQVGNFELVDEPKRKSKTEGAAPADAPDSTPEG